jgi:hypothetical protein
VAYVVAPVVMPADLAGVGNGTLPAALLTGVPGGGALHHLAARAWRAMLAAAAADGVTLRQTSAGDLFRPLSQQTALFVARYTTIPQPGRPSKQWQSRTWWLRPGMAPAAVPGTSNHGWGIAADTCTMLNGTVYSLHPTGTGVGRRAWDWLIDNYERFGWSHEYRLTSPIVEPWHIRYVAGDAVPAAVLAHENPLQPPVPPDPPVPPVVTPEERMLAIYRPTFDSPGYDPAWFVVFSSGLVRRATNADVTMAGRLSLPTIELNSPDQYDELLRVSGSTYPGRP